MMFVFSLPPLRNGGRGVQCLLLLVGVPGHTGNGLLNQAAEVLGRPGL